MDRLTNWIERMHSASLPQDYHFIQQLYGDRHEFLAKLEQSEQIRRAEYAKDNPALLQTLSFPIRTKEGVHLKQAELRHGVYADQVRPVSTLGDAKNIDKHMDEDWEMIETKDAEATMEKFATMIKTSDHNTKSTPSSKVSHHALGFREISKEAWIQAECKLSGKMPEEAEEKIAALEVEGGFKFDKYFEVIHNQVVVIGMSAVLGQDGEGYLWGAIV